MYGSVRGALGNQRPYRDPMLYHTRPCDNRHLNIDASWEELFFENFF
jgi:hypothetical protein